MLTNEERAMISLDTKPLLAEYKSGLQSLFGQSLGAQIKGQAKRRIIRYFDMNINGHSKLVSTGCKRKRRQAELMISLAFLLSTCKASDFHVQSFILS